MDGIASAVTGGAEFALGDRVIRGVRIAFRFVPLLVDQGLNRCHRRGSGRCSPNAIPTARIAGAGYSTVGRIGVADDDVVTPNTVAGKQGNVRNITNAVGRVTKNAGLPGGLGVALACGVFDIRDGRGRIEKGRACCAATRTSTARCGIKQSVLRSYGAIAEPLVP